MRIRRLAWLGLFVLLVSTTRALASPNCTLPYTLTNGQTADATQVMANFNAIVSCMGSPSIGFVNKFRNGTFDVWQRGATPPLSASGAYTADGWKVYFTGTAPSVVQQASGPGDGAPTLYGFAIGGATGNTDVKVGQRIESTVVTPLAGQRVTFQIQLFNLESVAVTPQLSTCYASATDNFSACISDLAATNLQSCNPLNLCTLSYTFNVSTNASKGYEVDIDLGAATVAGTDFRVYAADIRGTPGVPVGLNSAPPPPELRPIGAELPLCQRYLYVVTAQGLANAVMSEVGIALSSSEIVPGIRFPVSMRAIPSLIVSAASDFTNLSSGGGFSGNTFTSASLGAATTTDRGFLIFGGSSGTGLTAGQAAFLGSADTNARLTFGAEL